MTNTAKRIPTHLIPNAYDTLNVRLAKQLCAGNETADEFNMVWLLGEVLKERASLLSAASVMQENIDDAVKEMDNIGYITLKQTAFLKEAAEDFKQLQGWNDV